VNFLLPPLRHHITIDEILRSGRPIYVFLDFSIYTFNKIPLYEEIDVVTLKINLGAWFGRISGEREAFKLATVCREEALGKDCRWTSTCASEVMLNRLLKPVTSTEKDNRGWSSGVVRRRPIPKIAAAGKKTRTKKF
jgi:hypothetical protein